MEHDSFATSQWYLTMPFACIWRITIFVFQVIGHNFVVGHVTWLVAFVKPWAPSHFITFCPPINSSMCSFRNINIETTTIRSNDVSGYKTNQRKWLKSVALIHSHFLTIRCENLFQQHWIVEWKWYPYLLRVNESLVEPMLVHCSICDIRWCRRCSCTSFRFRCHHFRFVIARENVSTINLILQLMKSRSVCKFFLIMLAIRRQRGCFRWITTWNLATYEMTAFFMCTVGQCFCFFFRNVDVEKFVNIVKELLSVEE